MKTILFETQEFAFELETFGEPDVRGARIVRLDKRQEGTDSNIVLFDYSWPLQLTVEIEACKAVLQDDVLSFTLAVTAHHVKGMAQGEFTEKEMFEVEHPFGTPEELCCIVRDIVRKTRFAIEERHLKHLPNRTYPPVCGRQGPYGHP